jgi:glutamyl-tRNA reductase
MSNTLRYISISHLSASVKEREVFYFSEMEKREFMEKVQQELSDIGGIMLLVTCNRTEVYFESKTTLTTDFLKFFLRMKKGRAEDQNARLFSRSDKTEQTANHLLEVSTGLLSKVLGDAEIIAQIKKAFQVSIDVGAQGSLLERAMQMVFRNHKRIRNETHFRDGTTSVAYKTLKVISQTFGKEAMEDKKILFIGAGDIVKQLFKYNSKFNFRQIAISNRTRETAERLARQQGCVVYDWAKVMANDFADFDIIIGAAGNSHRLIQRLNKNPGTRLLIDLGLPSNIDPSLSKSKDVIFYDLDAISTALENTKKERVHALEAVYRINGEELLAFKKWLKEAPLRKVLANQKITVYKGAAGYLKKNKSIQDPEMIRIVTNRVLRQLYHQSASTEAKDKILDLIEDQSHFE